MQSSSFKDYRKTCAALVLSAALALFGVSASEANTLRYAYRIDASSLDPQALAETFTLAFLGMIYEPLVGRGKNLELVPALATDWEVVDDTTWRFHLRPNVVFHDGAPFTADDVLFSYQRGIKENSDVAYMVANVAEVKKVDDLTVDFITRAPTGILPEQLSSFYIMSQSWAETNDTTDPSSVAGDVRNYAAANANGTGPFKVQSRDQDTRTVLVPHEEWWGEVEHNLTKAIFTPVESDATRVAALLSGELDMIYPLPIQDIERVESAQGLVAMQGPELRTIFMFMDIARDELLESNIEGKNPFKDRRVRLAMCHAIDLNAIQDRVMRGASTPAGLMVAPGMRGFDKRLNDPCPYNPDLSRQLLVEAGYPDGFQVGMDCPNDRYVNDEQICIAIVGMLAQIGIEVDLLAQTRTRYFEKILSRDTSMGILGWQPFTYDAHSPLQDVMSTPDGEAIGTYNIGGYSNPRVDLLTQLVETEIDPERRQAFISGAFAIHKHDVGHIPLHQQKLSWGVRENIDLVQRPDDSFDLRWVMIND